MAETNCPVKLLPDEVVKPGIQAAVIARRTIIDLIG